MEKVKNGYKNIIQGGIMPKISNDWLDVIGEEFEKEYYLGLRSFLYHEYKTKKIFPKADDIFNAYHFTPYKNLKVLILGQDPYHNINQAHGLCFSVKKGVAIPPSLVNIYKEINEDLGLTMPQHGYLKKWADEGVFLLNTVLTVRAHQAHSHKNKGWETFTDATIKAINLIDRPVVIMLWGKPAQSKIKFLNNPKHLILTAPHPSPLSAYRGFFACKHFSRCNNFLMKHGIDPIDWQIE